MALTFAAQLLAADRCVRGSAADVVVVVHKILPIGPMVIVSRKLLTSQPSPRLLWCQALLQRVHVPGTTAFPGFTGSQGFSREIAERAFKGAKGGERKAHVNGLLKC